MKQILSSAFNANAAVLYVIAAVVILYVLAQSIFFLVRAVKQSNKIGMTKALSDALRVVPRYFQSHLQ